MRGAYAKARLPVNYANDHIYHAHEEPMPNLTFELTSEFIEVNQLLKLTGLCSSGGAGKNMVASGAVLVDGKKELRKTAKIRAGQVVRVGDVRISVTPGNPDGA
jgi:ribosome-associated protein